MVQLLKARKEKPKYKPMMWSSSDMWFFFLCHSCYFSWHAGEVDEKIWDTEMDGGGTVHETALLPHFAIHMYGLWIQNSCYE